MSMNDEQLIRENHSLKRFSYPISIILDQNETLLLRNNYDFFARRSICGSILRRQFLEKILFFELEQIRAIHTVRAAVRGQGILIVTNLSWKLALDPALIVGA